jgi:hypothetical protein
MEVEAQSMTVIAGQKVVGLVVATARFEGKRVPLEVLERP